MSSFAMTATGLGHAATWFIPSLLIALAYHKYEETDPESRPIIRDKLYKQYDFIISEYWVVIVICICSLDNYLCKLNKACVSKLYLLYYCTLYLIVHLKKVNFMYLLKNYWINYFSVDFYAELTVHKVLLSKFNKYELYVFHGIYGMHIWRHWKLKSSSHHFLYQLSISGWDVWFWSSN